jgi:hypothetical protein
MTAQIDQFCDKLTGRLNTMSERIQSAKSQIEGLPDKGEKAIRKLLDNARSNVDSREQQVDQALANFKARTQQKGL